MGARSCLCSQKHRHMSRAEAAYCNQLALRMKDANAGERVVAVENQPRIRLDYGASWRLDFRVWLDMGGEDAVSYLVDVKGFETRIFKRNLREYRGMLTRGLVTEPLLIAHVRYRRGVPTFRENWYGKDKLWTRAKG